MRTGWGGWRWGAAAVVLGAVGVWLLSRPIAVRQVSVTGTERMARAEVARLTGVAAGTTLDYGQACRAEAGLRRMPAFARATVTRGLTGVLHVRVTERAPVAWMRRAGCAVSAEGYLLPHFSRREAGWVALDDFATARGMVVDRASFAEALELAGMIGALRVGDAGVVRRLPTEGWEWSVAGKRVRLSSPLVPAELGRLGRFREAYPAAWSAAGRLDLRFRDRLVVKP